MPEQREPSYAELATRLAEAEQALAALGSGEVDALVVPVAGGARVYALEGADAFYRGLVEQMPEGAAVVTRHGRVLYANSRCSALVGVPLDRLVARRLTDLVEPGHRRRLLDALSADEDPTALEMTLRTPDGTAVPVSVSVSRAAAAASGAGARCVLLVDQTERASEAEAVREAEALFRSAFDSAPIGMALVDLEGRVELVNSALCAIAAAPRHALLGRELASLALEQGDVRRVLEAALRGTQEAAALDCLWQRTDGRQVPVAVALSVVRGLGGQPLHVIAQVQDRSERIRHEEQLRALAEQDGLTGLLNRRGFEAALTQHLLRVERYGGEGSLLLLDVDHLKYVNDSRGHQAGDAVLVAVGECLRSRLRASDVVARLGGDEFAVLLPHDDGSSAQRVGEDVVALVRGLSVPGGNGVRQVTVSAGLAAVPAQPGSGSALLAEADRALYQAKARGRDRLVRSSGPDTPQGERDPADSHLRLLERALADGTMVRVAQPIVALGTRQAVRHELLVRLPGPDGLVPAELWFPQAERCGLAPVVDEWVVQQALRLMKGEDGLQLHVNVSGSSLGQSGWLTGVQAELASSGVHPGRLTFEVAAPAATGHLDAVVAFAEQLRRLGCRLSLDDFGAGSASFSSLKHLPFDEIKIDGEFVRDCVHDDRDRAIIRAMVDVVHSLGREAVAECVEDAETLDVVHAHGVDLVQGYFLGRPEPMLVA